MSDFIDKTLSFLGLLRCKYCGSKHMVWQDDLKMYWCGSCYRLKLG